MNRRYHLENDSSTELWTHLKRTVFLTWHAPITPVMIGSKKYSRKSHATHRRRYWIRAVSNWSTWSRCECSPIKWNGQNLNMRFCCEHMESSDKPLKYTQISRKSGTCARRTSTAISTIIPKCLELYFGNVWIWYLNLLCPNWYLPSLLSECHRLHSIQWSRDISIYHLIHLDGDVGMWC